MAGVGYDELRGSHLAFGGTGGCPRRVLIQWHPKEHSALGPVMRGGAEIALVTFFTDKPPFAGLSGATPPARPYKAGIAHRCSLVSLRAEGLPSLVLEPPDSPMGLLAPKTPSEPQSNSPPGWSLEACFWGLLRLITWPSPVWLDPLYFGVFSKGGSSFLA